MSATTRSEQFSFYLYNIYGVDFSYREKQNGSVAISAQKMEDITRLAGDLLPNRISFYSHSSKPKIIVAEIAVPHFQKYLQARTFFTPVKLQENVLPLLSIEQLLMFLPDLQKDIERLDYDHEENKINIYSANSASALTIETAIRNVVKIEDPSLICVDQEMDPASRRIQHFVSLYPGAAKSLADQIKA